MTRFGGRQVFLIGHITRVVAAGQEWRRTRSLGTMARAQCCGGVSLDFVLFVARCGLGCRVIERRIVRRRQGGGHRTWAAGAASRREGEPDLVFATPDAGSGVISLVWDSGR